MYHLTQIVFVDRWYKKKPMHFFLPFSAPGDRGSKWVKMKITQLFFALIEDFGCSFKLNFDGRGGKKW